MSDRQHRRAYPTAPYVPITPSETTQQPHPQSFTQSPQQPMYSSLQQGHSTSSISSLPPSNEYQYPYYRKPSEELTQSMGALGISNISGPASFDLMSCSPSVYDMFETTSPRVPLTVFIFNLYNRMNSRPFLNLYLQMRILLIKDVQ